MESLRNTHTAMANARRFDSGAKACWKRVGDLWQQGKPGKARRAMRRSAALMRRSRYYLRQAGKELPGQCLPGHHENAALDRVGVADD